MKLRILSLLLLVSAAFAQMRVVAQASKSPLVTFRVVFTTGSAADPVDKPGLAYLTGMMLANGGTRQMTYQQISDALFPMAASVGVQVDKEMTTFYGATHVDNLAAYYKLLRGMLLDPGWRADDFQRVRNDAVNSLRVGLRGNDEELAKEALYQNIYAGTPYGHYAAGTVTSLEKLTLNDVKGFYHSQYSQTNLILGIAGGFSQSFLEAMKKDFRALPQGAGFRPRVKLPAMIDDSRVEIITKDTRSAAISIGFPISVTRDSADYPALLVAASYLGQHRMSGSLLFDEMRSKRGLNYGDYAYIEYFPRGMYRVEPSPNLARHEQIFQMWIRPVPPAEAEFAVRLAVYELGKTMRDGISEQDFERSRDFVEKYANILTRTASARLGYAIDSMWYGSPAYDAGLQIALPNVTRADVNAVIKRYLRVNRLVITVVTKDGEALKQQLASGAPSPIQYASPKPQAILEADQQAEKWPLDLSSADIQVVPAPQMFQ